MRSLQLARVDTADAVLILTDPNGREYSLPLDNALRSAVATDTTAAQADLEQSPTPEPLSPREIQARIRAGATAHEIAEQTGTDLQQILRYEGPVLAERHYITQQAQAAEVSAPQLNEGYRAVFGDEPASLGEMVEARLRTCGVDVETLEWDAWKINAGSWALVAHFELPDSATNVGGEPPAEWTFHPTRRHVENRNRWAQVLSEWEPWDASAPPRRLVPVTEQAEHPFNVEDDTGSDDDSGEENNHGLLDVLTRRRGTRVGEDAEGDDKLAHLIARSHKDRENTGASADTPDRTDGQHIPDTQTMDFPRLRSVPDPVPASSHTGRDEHDAPDETSTDRHHPTRGRGAEQSRGRHTEPETDEQDDSSTAGHKKRRSQVPSWDEIVFGRGTRHPDDE